MEIVYCDLGDDEKMVGDKCTFFYDSVEQNIWVVRGYDVKNILTMSWFFNMRSEIPRHHGVQLITDTARTTAGTVEVITENQIIRGGDIDVDDQVGQFLQEGVQRQVRWSVYVDDDERAQGRFDGDELDLERGKT